MPDVDAAGGHRGDAHVPVAPEYESPFHGLARRPGTRVASMERDAALPQESALRVNVRRTSHDDARAVRADDESGAHAAHRLRGVIVETVSRASSAARHRQVHRAHDRCRCERRAPARARPHREEPCPARSVEAAGVALRVFDAAARAASGLEVERADRPIEPRDLRGVNPRSARRRRVRGEEKTPHACHSTLLATLEHGRLHAGAREVNRERRTSRSTSDDRDVRLSAHSSARACRNVSA